MKSKNEGRNKILVGLFIIAFFMIAYTCTAQISRHQMTDKEVSCRILNDECIVYTDTVSKEDFCKIQMFADSMFNGSYVISIVVDYYKKGYQLAQPVLKITMSDGTVIVPNIRSDYKFKDGRVQYFLDNDSSLKMYYMHITDIKCEGLLNHSTLNVSYNKMYFYKFFNSLWGNLVEK